MLVERPRVVVLSLSLAFVMVCCWCCAVIASFVSSRFGLDVKDIFPFLGDSIDPEGTTSPSPCSRWKRGACGDVPVHVGRFSRAEKLSYRSHIACRVFSTPVSCSGH